jgi:hypothetical protein
MTWQYGWRIPRGLAAAAHCSLLHKRFYKQNTVTRDAAHGWLQRAAMRCSEYSGIFRRNGKNLRYLLTASWMNGGATLQRLPLNSRGPALATAFPVPSGTASLQPCPSLIQPRKGDIIGTMPLLRSFLSYWVRAATKMPRRRRETANVACSTPGLNSRRSFLVNEPELLVQLHSF